MEFLEYIKPELLILVPVLFLLGMGLRKSELANKHIPLCLGVFSVALCTLWVLATGTLTCVQDIAMAIFTALSQGILIAGASVYAHQLYRQSKKDD